MMTSRQKAPMSLRLVPIGGVEARTRSIQDRDLEWSIWMARAQNGDRDAYLRLLTEITPHLRRRLRRWHALPQDLEDSLQDVLLSLHAVRQTYDPTRPFGPWLDGIANRRAFDRLRRQYRTRKHETSLTEDHEGQSAEIDEHHGSTDHRLLEAAISALPPAQQQAIRMTKLKEMSLEEASRASGISAGALKVATHRAIKSLRSLLVREVD